ncbi:N-acetylneuraminate epimerase [Photobacterium nomapromontoriensis]|uniref:N-acetylneuraminate epimerase n=1 Tax=Photobacterium nomapromontoriensis TaxID=2910237 RepID=UPI003D0971EC
MSKKYVNKLITPIMTASLILSASVYAQTQWPDLPVGLKNGVSAQIGDTLFVGLGSTGNDFYMLDLNALDKGWQKKADFIGQARDGATASVINDDIYIFGGSGKKSSTDLSPIVFDSVYRYSASSNKWAELRTTSPVGLLGAASYSPNKDVIVFFGGYNKAYFDQYLSDIITTDQKAQPEKWQKIVDDYMGMKPLDYKWNRDVIRYNPEKNQWDIIDSSPYIPNCGATLVSTGTDATLISGEIKPGLRTAEVKQYQYGQPQPWQSLHDLPAPKSSSIQEGVAGAFSGLSNGVIIVTGGANFHGAKGAFEQGNMFAHNGFNKSSNAETYVLKDGLWSQSTSLSEGLAYGASFTTPQGVLIVGGEDNQRQARNGVYMLTWNGKTVDIID